MSKKSTSKTLIDYTVKERRVARLIAHSYTEQKCKWTGDPYRKVLDNSNPQYQYFLKAARKIEKMRERHKYVQPTRFVWVTFSYFGTRTFPAHLSSDKVWKMFFRWENRRQAVTATGVDFSAEEEMLQHVCASRGQILQNVWPTVKNSGMFTPAFVSHLDAILKDQI